MRISIVTPSYNQDNFVRETIESVLSQDWEDIEYVVVEGGSRDGSGQIVDEYARRGLLKVVSYPGSSQAQAINRGFSETSGDVLAWLNSDDIYLDHALKRVAGCFDSHPEVEALYGHELSINESGEVIGFRLTEAGLDLKKAEWIGISIPQPAVFFKRHVYEELGGLDEKYDFSLDTEYWYRMIKRFRFVHLPQVLAATRHHKSSKTGVGNGVSSFGSNKRRFYEESARAFLVFGGKRIAPYYLQNRINYYCKTRNMHRLLSGLIRIYARITSTK